MASTILIKMGLLVVKITFHIIKKRHLKKRHSNKKRTKELYTVKIDLFWYEGNLVSLTATCNGSISRYRQITDCR